MNNKVLVIGGCGYIGTRLVKYLTMPKPLPKHLSDLTTIEVPFWEVDSVDLEWFGNPAGIQNTVMDFRLLTKEQLSKYGTIVLLAAYSSPAFCTNSGTKSVVLNNMMNFEELLPKLSEGQKFIYASSITVYPNGVPEELEEDRRIISNYNDNLYDASKKWCDSAMARYPHVEFYGLRLATVCGLSKNWRNDIMVNAMTDNALLTSEVKVFNPRNNKPILYIGDLTRAIETIMFNPHDNRGFYNLASYNGITEEIAETVASLTHSRLKVLSSDDMLALKLPTSAYDFTVSTKKFEQTFDFKFEGDTKTITNEIMYLIDMVEKSKRVDPIIYEY